jgi:protein-disulfide isomerase
MSRNVKISAALVALFVVMIAAIVLTANSKDDEPVVAAATTTQAAPTTTTEAAPAPAPTETAPKGKSAPKDKSERATTLVVAPDPRTLGQPGDGKVTFTEFLDFECPACGAAYPLVEQLRQQYQGRVTFNIRYFPLPSHRNAMPAALAAEAAAQQGKLEPMYSKLFQTQQQWGGQSTSQAKVFRGFARELGLDMPRYDADVRSRETRKRVRRDFDAAAALELQGTPSFFVNEQPITPESPDQLRGLLDAALAGKPLPAQPSPHDPNDPDHSHDALGMTEA